MTANTLFAAIGNIDDTFIEDAAASPKRRTTVLIKWATLAACAIIIIFAAATLFSVSSTDAPSTVGTADPQPTVTTTVTENADNVPPAIVYPSEDDRYIAPINTGEFTAEQYAHAPYPGDCYIGMYASHSSPHYNDPNALYWVSIAIYGEGGKPLMYGDEKRAEAQRLSDLGYEIYIKELHWIGYWGEDKHYTAVCGLFTREHLENFQMNPNYGYALDFCSYDIEETERIQ